jgi:hypothetical protein
MKGLLFFVILFSFWLVGCAPQYASNEEYLETRGKALDAASNRPVELGGDVRWHLWVLNSGQCLLDQLTPEPPLKLKETFFFKSEAEADAWITLKQTKDTASEMPLGRYYAERGTELGTSTGEWIGNIEDGFLYGWRTPDGTWTVDTLKDDMRGGVTTVETQVYPTKEAAVEQAVPLNPTVQAFIDKRSQELGGTIHYGMDHRVWRLFGFRLANGEYALDVIGVDTDRFEGVLSFQEQRFENAESMARWVGSQFLDPKETWVYGSQYRRFGFLLVGPVLVFVAFVLFNIIRAKKAKGVTIRRIAGLDQIDEAVGRATETARPVLMVPGLGSLTGITVQALTIFAYVVRTAARFATPIRLLNADASVYAVAQEITRDVYISEGVPEQYDPESVRFVSDRQFAFAAGVAGVIQRDRVAATFFFGDFYAESMIFAENANIVGAIQVAATTQFTQTPFFIAACDYVLLGDEFYAASAYLGRQPVLVGSLVGVDWAKMVAMAFTVVAVVVHTIQIQQPFDENALPIETRDELRARGQQYPDWIKDDLFFKRMTKLRRM